MVVNVQRSSPELSCPLWITDEDSLPASVIDIPPVLCSPFQLVLVVEVHVVILFLV